MEGSPDRVVRGGSFLSHAFNLRTAARVPIRPDMRHRGLGFRLVKNP